MMYRPVCSRALVKTQPLYLLMDGEMDGGVEGIERKGGWRERKGGWRGGEGVMDGGGSWKSVRRND